MENSSNAHRQRIIKETSGKTTIYHYDQLGNIISEKTIGTETVRDYIYIGHSRVAMVVSKRCLADIDKDNDVDGSDLVALASDFNRSDCSTASPCPGDVNGDEVVDSGDLSILASELGRTDCPHDEYYYFHNDHLGTPQKITDQAGAVVWSANYKPFGEASITTETITNPFRFPGQYFDPETGLHYNYFRYYDPVIGRYLRVDPAIETKLNKELVSALNFNQKFLLKGIFSPYSYTQPLRFIDFRGLSPQLRPSVKTPNVGDFVQVINEFLNFFNAVHLTNQVTKRINELASTIPCGEIRDAYVCFNPGPPPHNLSVGLGWVWHSPKLQCIIISVKGTKGCECIIKQLNDTNLPQWRQR